MEDQKSHHRRSKTLEWHEHALKLFQHYLLAEQHCLLLGQITPTQVRDWVTLLTQMPTTRGLLQHMLAHIGFLEQSLHSLLAEIEQRLQPYEQAITRWMQLPGIQRQSAMAILAEIGDDMSHFPSAKHLCSWAGVAPGNKQSGGRRLHAPTTKGNTRLRAALAEVVWVISHTKGNYLSAQYHRLAHRIGKKKAIVAVSHTVLTIIYHLLRDHSDYHDLGPTYFETLEKERLCSSALRRLESLGYTVTLEEVPA